MDWEALLEGVPQLLLLIIPGFIALEVQDEFEPKKKRDETHIILYSVLYSFIISTVFQLIVTLLGLWFTSISDALNSHTEIVNISYIILAVILGAILAKSPQQKSLKRFFKWLDPTSSPEPDVWSKALKKMNGAWATVYLDNGMIYTGKLINYTNDPNDEHREILLSDFRLAIKNDSENAQPRNFCHVIADHTNETNTSVYLKAENIIAIELFDSTSNS